MHAHPLSCTDREVSRSSREEDVTSEEFSAQHEGLPGGVRERSRSERLPREMGALERLFSRGLAPL